MQILDDGLWDRVKNRQQAMSFGTARDENGQAINRAFRQRLLHSGRSPATGTPMLGPTAKAVPANAARAPAPTRPPSPASESLRSQFDKIERAPRPQGEGLDAHLYGDLEQILMFCKQGEHKRKNPGAPVPGSQLSVVAGASDRRELTLSVNA